jgi:hypothetical protein
MRQIRTLEIITLGLGCLVLSAGCGSDSSKSTAAAPQALSNAPGLTIRVNNKLADVKSQNPNGTVTTTSVDIQGEVCGIAQSPSQNQSVDPNDRGIACHPLQGKVKSGASQDFHLTPSELQPLFAKGNGRFIFAFKDSIQLTGLYYICWAQEVMLSANFNQNQSVEIDVTGRHTFSYSCNVIKR